MTEGGVFGGKGGGRAGGVCVCVCVCVCERERERESESERESERARARERARMCDREIGGDLDEERDVGACFVASLHHLLN